MSKFASGMAMQKQWSSYGNAMQNALLKILIILLEMNKIPGIFEK